MRKEEQERKGGKGVEVTVGTLNVRGLTSKNGCHWQQLEAALDLLEEQGVEVAAICETWFKEAKAVEEAKRWCREKGWRWIDHKRTERDDREKKGSGGVALLVKTEGAVRVVSCAQPRRGREWCGRGS